MDDLDRILHGYDLVLDERFDADRLDETIWIPHHLPQWSSRAQSAARYDLGPHGLTLRIDADQESWCPELDGSTRVSAVQTGVASGPLGSREGQHRFHPDAVVREAQPARQLMTPRYGLIRLRARAEIDRDAMVALWMFGIEDEPEHSGVIDLMEIFGRDVTPTSARVGMNLKAFADPALTDDVTTVDLPIDIRELHDYAVDWTPQRLRFFVDGVHVRTVEQSPDYAMVLLVGIYDFDQQPRPVSAPGASPDASRRFVIERLQVHRPRG